MGQGQITYDGSRTIDLHIDTEGARPNKQIFGALSFTKGNYAQRYVMRVADEISFRAMFGADEYYQLMHWWSKARTGELFAFAEDSAYDFQTTLDGTVSGATVPVASTTGFSVGDIVEIYEANGTESEIIEIDSISTGVSITATVSLLESFVSGDICKHFKYWPKCVADMDGFKPMRTGIEKPLEKYFQANFVFKQVNIDA